MDFIAIAMDQVVNQAAKMRYMFGGKAKIPLVIRCGVGGYLNAAAQHSQSLESWFTHIPGLKIVAVGTPSFTKSLVEKNHFNIFASCIESPHLGISIFCIIKTPFI